MNKQKTISGFSKLSKRGKIKWIVENFFKDPENVARELKSYWHGDEAQQKILDGFSENTISNFPMPFGVAPNFKINDKVYCVPMVIEESSVVAAAAAAGKFWMNRGGIRAKVIDVQKIGQVSFKWEGDIEKLKANFTELEKLLRADTAEVTRNMEKRGGGINKIELIDFSNEEPNCYQLKISCNTKDSMGANFINSVLESFGQTLQKFVATSPVFSDKERDLTIIMCILSNYTPDCLVKAWVECPVEELGDFAEGMTAAAFAEKFALAVRIARIDPFRAVTHNKGIYNGIDAVVLATGNDFRAIEAAGHAYAARDGQYRSLSQCEVKDGMFKFWLEVPLALGTVGGLTKLHPIAKRSLEMLENPTAEEFMKIVASVGLGQNFAALRSLVTTGIQQGHMKMHLTNILNHFQATENEEQQAIVHFEEESVSFNAVRLFLESHRGAPIDVGM